MLYLLKRIGVYLELVAYSFIRMKGGTAMAHTYDLVILGGGTGGYVAAIRASQLGLKTAIVEKEKLGGTCLHKGCIPSKALLRSAEVYRVVKDDAFKFGIEVSGVSLQFDKVQERKRQVVEQLFQGVERLIDKGKIDVFYGIGRMLGPSIFSPLPGTISVEMADGSENVMLISTNVIIATGSSPRGIDGIDVDGSIVMNSDHALQMETLPTSILIVGGGVIGVEWASMLHDFGVEVTILEYGSRILATEDEDVSREMERLLKKRGIRIVTQAKLLTESFVKTDQVIQVNVEVNGNLQWFEAERMLISIGRVANTEGIGIENTDIEIESGYIKVRESYQTKEPHIYAIGDCIGGMQLAHVASHEGIAAIEHIVHYTVQPLSLQKIPRCVYSYPEIASIGLTEAQAKQQGFHVKTGKFPFKGVGKAVVYGESDGFVKMVVDSKTNDVLGVHMVGPHVTDMISEVALANLLDATPWEIGKTIHPHPSLSEAIGEAAVAVEGRAIHM